MSSSSSPMNILAIKTMFYDALRSSLYLATRIHDNTKRNNYIKSLSYIYYQYQSEGGAKQVDQMWYYQSQCYKVMMKMEFNHFNFEGHHTYTYNQNINNLISNIEKKFDWVHFPNILNDEFSLSQKKKYSVEYLNSIIYERQRDDEK